MDAVGVLQRLLTKVGEGEAARRELNRVLVPELEDIGLLFDRRGFMLFSENGFAMPDPDSDPDGEEKDGGGENCNHFNHAARADKPNSQGAPEDAAPVAAASTQAVAGVPTQTVAAVSAQPVATIPAPVVPAAPAPPVTVIANPDPVASTPAPILPAIPATRDIDNSPQAAANDTQPLRRSTRPRSSSRSRVESGPKPVRPVHKAKRRRTHANT